MKTIVPRNLGFCYGIGVLSNQNVSSFQSVNLNWLAGGKKERRELAQKESL
jgi:hypothetical protein